MISFTLHNLHQPLEMLLLHDIAFVLVEVYMGILCYQQTYKYSQTQPTFQTLIPVGKQSTIHPIFSLTIGQHKVFS